MLRNKIFYLPQQDLIQHLCLNVADKSFWLSCVMFVEEKVDKSFRMSKA